MKNLIYTLVLIISLTVIISCGGRGNVKDTSESVSDTTTVADTGYTGIKKYMSGRYLIKEITFKNGVREGLMKSFYQDGNVRQTFWYKAGLREDSARWLYEGGQVFRSTPYVHDTIDGIQKQYYRNGKTKAEIGYKKGLRTSYFKEFDQNGKLVTNYPEVVVNVKDEYKTKGLYQITLSLSDKSTKVRFYRGSLENNVFDTTKCQVIKTVKGIGTLDLKKSNSQKPKSVGIITDMLTNYRQQIHYL